MAQLGEEGEICDANIANLRAQLEDQRPELRLASLSRRILDERYITFWTLLVHFAMAQPTPPCICYVSQYPTWGPCLAFQAGKIMTNVLQQTMALLQLPPVDTLPPVTIGAHMMETYLLRKSAPLSLLEVYQCICSHGGKHLCFCFSVPGNAPKTRILLELEPVVHPGQKRLQFLASNGKAYGLARCAKLLNLRAASQLTASNVQRNSIVQWQLAEGQLQQQSLERLRYEGMTAVLEAQSPDLPAAAPAAAPLEEPAAAPAAAPLEEPAAAPAAEIDVAAMAARLQQWSSSEDDY